MKNEQLDEVDEELIAFLFQNGREKLTKLAEMLQFVKKPSESQVKNKKPSMSHVSVQKRLVKLQEKMIKIQANCHINALKMISAYAMIETKDYETERRLIEKSRLCPRVSLVDRLSGKYNILIQIICPSIGDVNCFISSVIKSDDQIRSYKVYNSISNVKPGFIPIPQLSLEQKENKNTPCGMNCLFCGMYKDGTCLGCPATSFQNKKYSEFFSN
ncbi:hypothetical protein NEF87_001352 [Candidatus Lokiarchaeum ossiferum]|uniref:Lrp/AsnC family transcriptional regulator n=1 Tax=Candidatus Lokiarchaeum ossiferum TaxID=2951803 RepID=A0ABY6HRP8_9ARCH|nr:hypothetical protein NEF87_001352 [Candidatus Lokiarchaeum sp. B-35]